jgi:hypothetical protein
VKKYLILHKVAKGHVPASHFQAIGEARACYPQCTVCKLESTFILIHKRQYETAIAIPSAQDVSNFLRRSRSEIGHSKFVVDTCAMRLIRIQDLIGQEVSSASDRCGEPFFDPELMNNPREDRWPSPTTLVQQIHQLAIARIAPRLRKCVLPDESF